MHSVFKLSRGLVQYISGIRGFSKVFMCLPHFQALKATQRTQSAALIQALMQLFSRHAGGTLPPTLTWSLYKAIGHSLEVLNGPGSTAQRPAKSLSFLRASSSDRAPRTSLGDYSD